MDINTSFLGRQVSRVVIGDNPITGHSYIPEIYDGEEMQDYYTADNTVKALFEAEKSGINTIIPLANNFMLRVLRQYRNEGGNLNIIFQPYPALDLKVNLKMMLKVNPFGIYHQGSLTDIYSERGEYQRIHDNIKLLKDSGVKVGICSHLPERIIRAEEENWGADFYMTSLYNARKKREGKQSGFITGKSKSFKFDLNDRLKMLKTIKQIQKPCIAFKVFAGGQVFYGKKPQEYKQTAYNTLKETFDNIKSSDIVCMGVFQKHKNQIKENMDIVKEILKR